MNIDLTELGLAYRRVKADLYYTKYANSVKLLRFERNLAHNLAALHEILVNERFVEVYGSFCHGWRLVPKAVKFEDEDKVSSKTTILVGDELRRVSRCDLRLIEDVPIEFHIIAQLWIDRLGGRLEQVMSSCSFGNRIRCNGSRVNICYPGTFKFWMSQYRAWHNDGLKTIRKALENGKNVTVLTADFAAFYHNLSPAFVENEEFLNSVGIHNISPDERKLTGLIVEMLKKWAELTPLGVGLPVGCSVSSVLANIALTLLDRKLESLPGLIYYGRYVDDIILAVENLDELNSQEQFLAWLCSKVPDLKLKDAAISYYCEPLQLPEGCELSFQKDKTKVFFFNGKDGKDFIVGLENQIHKRTSEWRALPELPNDPEELIKSIIAITDRHGTEVDKLRQSEEASIRRAAFAMKLSDFGDYAMSLDASDWSEQRNAFINAVSIYFTSVKNYFELSIYFPRLLGLALHGMSATDKQSFDLVEEMLTRVAAALKKALDAELFVAGRSVQILDNYFDCRVILTSQIAREFSEAVASTVKDDSVRNAAFALIQKAFPEVNGVAQDLPAYDEMLMADLSQEPYKTVLYSAIDIAQDDYKFDSYSMSGLSKILPKAMHDNAVEILNSRSVWRDKLLHTGAISGLVFPTRKLSRIELMAILPHPYGPAPGNRDYIEKYLVNVGYGDVLPATFVTVERGRRLIKVLNKTPSTETATGRNEGKHKPVVCEMKIALAYWRMSEEDWLYQFNGRRNPGNTARFTRLMKLTNDMLKSTSGEGGVVFDYIMYPELAMPWRWFLLIEKKVRQYGVSLITGVEYIRSARKRMLRNEVWCGLTYKGSGFPESLLIKVPKTCPAEEERRSLKAYGWSLDRVPSVGGFRAGDIIVHEHDKGALFFSALICSDLTDIDLRSKLRGWIDLLCVPAWNQDVKTFHALVTASAHDLHSYVALCNNGKFGDTRIRAPLINDYDRDVVQLKGGDNDYWVVGTVNIDAIKRFHANCPSPGDPKFKPLPSGFTIGKERKKYVVMLPIDEVVKKFKYITISGSSMAVSIPASKRGASGSGIKYEFAMLNSKERIFEQLGKLLVRNDVTKDVVIEFLAACKVWTGVEVGAWIKDYLDALRA